MDRPIVRLAPLLRPHRSPFRPALLPSRRSSSLSHLSTELPARRLPILYDYLSPVPTHLLNTTLADFLPPSFSTHYLPSPSPSPSFQSLPPLPTITPDPTLLPPAYHLIHFPPPIPLPLLLPDGTDPLQSPGPPFHRRMWAGGSLSFNLAHSPPGTLELRGQRAACVERIIDVGVKGREGEEKVFVGIERRVGEVGEAETEEGVRRRLVEEGEKNVACVERRNIVFMREGELEKKAGEKKILKASHPPTFSHTLTPSPFLLFRYSALTFNAHSIHLDSHYCRTVEQHRNLLVHGPLSFTLMVTMLNLHLKAQGSAQIKEIEYRNLAPLYATEEMKVCGREIEDNGKEGRKFELWVEGVEGGMSVRGVAKVV
ncbi:hypothetical protein EV356DRAFT_528982 [Viridothelium virens]|uniref:Thioesterase/thiol ester dehydrase-isomerase n=1 Tax=Viridothelium virens TaxID=1048519 RepID=A0A6A6HK56_VIRVR|nr:hypothetical protein EV356DRAFT_528982 [Viridothelium virens]